MEIYLIRHTTPDIENGICYGQSDVPLKNTSDVELLEVLKHVPATVEIVYTSPLTRCTKLADALSNHFHIPVMEDHRLMELNFGDWEMKKWNEIDPLLLKKWMDDYVHVTCPRGESYAELFQRVVNFSDEAFVKQHKSVALVTHHGVLKALHAKLKHVTLKQAMNIQFAYGSVSDYSTKMKSAL